MIEVEIFQKNLELFSQGQRSKKYDVDFDNFWRWKNNIEINSSNILDDKNYENTYKKLRNILPSWQVYRGTRNNYPYKTLKESLQNINESYNAIRKISLLNLNGDPIDDLKLIWHELGRVKEQEGEKRRDGKYFIISVCKPLMLLWGQTLAFDSRARFCIPRDFNVKMNDRRWTFNKWLNILIGFSNRLKEDNRLINFMREEAKKRYGTNALIPFGRFLDIYYFQSYD